MKKIRKHIAEIKDWIYDSLGGDPGAVKYFKKHPSAFYPDYFKTPPQPLVQNNVSVRVEHDEEAARAKLYDAFVRLIEARKASVEDPAVYVDGDRIIDGVPCTVDGVVVNDDPQPATADPRPATRDWGCCTIE
jgi:hypothetical protein